MSAPLLLIAAGGTGGHMFPAQALAEAMLQKGWRVKLSTDARGARYTGGFPSATEIEEVQSATFARRGALAKLAVGPRVLSGILAARGSMRQDRPSVVVGFGGYPSIPALGAAWLLGLPRMIHEQNGVLGRVNQIFATRVAQVACGTWPTALPSGVKGIHVGNPVRAAILDCAAAPYTAPGQGDLNVLIMGGSQGARILSDVVPAALAGVPEAMRPRLRVSHQARQEDMERVTTFYSDAGITADTQTFFTDVPQRMSQAQLVITRSGASTIADLSVIGRPSILIPLAAAIRDEQTANARALVEADAAVLIQERDLTPDALTQQILSILSDPARAAAMAQAALTTGAPDATQRLVELVENLAQKDLQ